MRIHPSSQPRGFSLVEVLIAIVVLALGLLGLAAVFPAVVTQQRQATDSVMGSTVQETVTNYLEQNKVFSKASRAFAQSDFVQGPYPVIAPASQRGWQLLSGNGAWSPPLSLQTFPLIASGKWEAVNPTLTSVGLDLETTTGNMRVIGTANSTTPNGDYDQPWFDIPLSSRLYPAPSTGSVQPIYVWDFVARRVAFGVTPPDASNNLGYLYGCQDDSIQLAVFVRRIDSGIRKPVGATLSAVLTGGVPAADRRVPVAEDSTTGRPTFDGAGGSTLTYSGIHTIEYNIPAALPATSKHKFQVGSYVVLDPSSSATALSPYARQAGQQLIDAWGVVHTVTAFLDRDPADSPSTVEITPPIDVSSYTNWPASAGVPSFIYTTQIPAAAFVVTVQTPTPGSTF